MEMQNLKTFLMGNFQTYRKRSKFSGLRDTKKQED